MVQGPSEEAIRNIANAPSLERQITTLRQLKNDIVGHDQRKELVVKHGVIKALIDVIAATQKVSGKRRTGDSNGTSRSYEQLEWSSEDEGRLQAIQILGSLANGGRAFVPPLLAAHAHTVLLECLAAAVPPRIITAALQALRSIATSARIEGEDGEQITLDLFGSDPAQFAFPNLQQQPNTSPTEAARQLKLAIEIIGVSATTEAVRTQLTDSGVLEHLASILASHALASRHFDYRGSANSFPPPPPTDTVPAILSAITAIISGSNFRVQSFILCRPICELFAHSKAQNGESHPFSSRSGAAETLLPPLYVPSTKSVSHVHSSSAFPAAKSLQPTIGRRPGGGVKLAQSTVDIEHANAVCAWMLFMARSMQGANRLTALRLVALLNNAINASTELVGPRSENWQRAQEREKQISMVAIPLAVQLTQVAIEGPSAGASLAEEREHREIKESACDVLGALCHSRVEWQTAAVHAGAIKRICSLLKKTFDNVTASKPMWSARTNTNDQADAPESCKLGKRGLPAEFRHAMRCRQSALHAAAALAKQEDPHRQGLMEGGLTQCIMDSMKPFPADAFTTSSSNKTLVTPKDGNTIPVLLAACDAAMSLSRSVSSLRTNLVDAGIAQPTFELVKRHHDIEIKMAATDVISNLLLEVSPMREDIIAQGAVAVLVRHVKGNDVELRLASLWALKNLAHLSSKEAKMQCLEELGPGWLVGAIQGEHSHNPDAPSNGGGVNVWSSALAGGSLSAPNAAGEQVDLLNPATSMDVDEDDEDEGDDDDGFSQGEEGDGDVIYDESSGTHYQSSQLRSTLHQPAIPLSSTVMSADRQLAGMRQMEQDPALKAREVDICIQEQALDFIRNLIDDPELIAPMVDHVLQQIGSEKIFSLLTEKMSPLAEVGARPVFYPQQVILAAVHVIVHLSASSPRHKSLVIAQTPMIRAWMRHFTCEDRRVRVMCMHAANSLTWVEDDEDRDAARDRCRKLRELGVESIVRNMVTDADLDVRQRAKIVVRLFDT